MLSLPGYGHFVGGIITINDKMVTPISLLEWIFGGNHDVKDVPTKKQIWTKVLQVVKLRQICQTSRQSTGATLIPPPLPPHCCVSLSQPPFPPFRCSSHKLTPIPLVCIFCIHCYSVLIPLFRNGKDSLYVVQLVLFLQIQESGVGMIFTVSAFCRFFPSKIKNNLFWVKTITYPARPPST